MATSLQESGINQDFIALDEKEVSLQVNVMGLMLKHNSALYWRVKKSLNLVSHMPYVYYH